MFAIQRIDIITSSPSKSILSLLPDFTPNDSNTYALIVLSSPKEVKDALLSAKKLNEKLPKLKLSPAELGDIGLEVQCNDKPMADEIESLVNSGVDVSYESAAYNSDVSAQVSFMSLQETIDAQASFQRGMISLSSVTSTSSSPSKGGSMITADVSTVPAYAVTVTNLPTDKSVATVLESLSSAQPLLSVLHTHRKGLVKFKRHSDVSAFVSFLVSLYLSALFQPSIYLSVGFVLGNSSTQKTERVTGQWRIFRGLQVSSNASGR